MHSYTKKLLLALIITLSLIATATISFASDESHVHNSAQLAEAIASKSSGGTIIVHSGNYSTATILGIKPTTPLTLKKATNEAVTFEGISIINSSNIIVTGFTSTKSISVVASHHITLSNLTVLNATGTGACGSQAGNSFQICKASSFITLENSLTKTTKFDTRAVNNRGLWLFGCACLDKTKWVKNITVRNNEFTNSWDDLVQVVGAENVTFLNNFIHDHRNTPGSEFHSDGIQVTHGNQINILGNTFTLRDRTAQHDQGIIVGNQIDESVKNVVIANNLIHNWAGSGITVHGASNVDIFNNTSVDNLKERSESFGILFSRGNGASNQNGQFINIRVWNNIFSKIHFDADLSWNSFTFASHNMVLIGSQGWSNPISGSPDFITRAIDSPNAFKIGSSSKAINAGIVMSPRVSTDHAGNLRDARPDVGAYEYVSSGRTTTTTTRPVTTTTTTTATRPTPTTTTTTRPVPIVTRPATVSTTTTTRPAPTTTTTTTRPVPTTTTTRPAPTTTKPVILSQPQILDFLLELQTLIEKLLAYILTMRTP